MLRKRTPESSHLIKINLASTEKVAKRILTEQVIPILPRLSQLVASGLTFSAVISSFQWIGYIFKVSCSTPLASQSLGLCSVFVASAASSQANTVADNFLSNKSWSTDESRNPPRDLLIDGILGSLLFKSLGGTFSKLMPSDLTQPGVGATLSVPAKGPEYANPSERMVLQEVFKKFGCHHCGSNVGKVISDHIPPSGTLFSKSLTTAKAAYVKGMAVQQRFFPQCQNCSSLQSQAVKGGKRVLVMYQRRIFPEPWQYSGVFLNPLREFIHGRKKSQLKGQKGR